MKVSEQACIISYTIETSNNMHVITVRDLIKSSARKSFEMGLFISVEESRLKCNYDDA